MRPPVIEEGDPASFIYTVFRVEGMTPQCCLCKVEKPDTLDMLSDVLDDFKDAVLSEAARTLDKRAE